MPKKPRPEILTGCTIRMQTGCGNMYVTINKNESGNPEEVFCRLGKAGGCASSQTEALGRLITLALKHGTALMELIEELRGINCHQAVLGQKKILSCSDAVAQILVAYISTQNTKDAPPKPTVTVAVPQSPEPSPLPTFHHDKVIQEVDALVAKETEKSSTTGACPDCGGVITHEAGCLLCYSCGWSKC